MADYPGWFQDPVGRHPERYFDSNGIPTQLVRSGGHEFTDADALPAPPPSDLTAAPAHAASSGGRTSRPSACNSEAELVAHRGGVPARGSARCSDHVSRRGAPARQHVAAQVPGRADPI